MLWKKCLTLVKVVNVNVTPDRGGVQVFFLILLALLFFRHVSVTMVSLLIVATSSHVAVCHTRSLLIWLTKFPDDNPALRLSYFYSLSHIFSLSLMVSSKLN